MRSNSAGSAGFTSSKQVGNAEAPELHTEKRMARSTRFTPFTPQFLKMSVAFVDHGEIVPLRGDT